MTAREQVAYVCRECGGESPKWAGQCPHCRAWNTLEEVRVRHRPARQRSAVASAPVPLSDLDLSQRPRFALQWQELNRVLGGGVVAGSLVLIGGEPGVGKSTLLMHLAQQVSREAGTVLYVSAEESSHQVGLRARRLKALSDRIQLLSEPDLDQILDAARKSACAVLVVDSIQTVYDPSLDASPGSVAQVRESAMRLLRWAKETSVPVFLVGHVTKDGAIAGPRTLEHMVDTVLYLEGERQQEHRILRAQKNRFGSTDEIGIFAMSESGLEEVLEPGAADRGPGQEAPGSVVSVALEGSRPLLVEVQTLVTPTAFGLPRRTATGIDLGRLHMVMAVLERRAGMSLATHDVFANIAGGFRIAEPALDLALALSLAGNLIEGQLPSRVVALGELGLGGEVRRVAQADRRLQEAARRGYEAAIVPAGMRREAPLRVFEVQDLGQALRIAYPTRAGVAG